MGGAGVERVGAYAGKWFVHGVVERLLATCSNSVNASFWQCSDEVVVLGILRIVEEILEKRPTAKVVINSIFPMTSLRGGLYPVISDYEDSFGRTMGGQRNLDAAASAATVPDGRDLLFWREKKKVASPTPEVLPSHPMTDAELSVAAEKEEEARNEQARKEQPRSWLQHRPVNNPIMVDKTKVRKYELGKNIIHRSAQPLWTSIKAINKELRKFANKQDRVFFFDATDLFTVKEEKEYILLTDLLTVRGHPTEQGFVLWEDAIVDKIYSVLDMTKEERPPMFNSSGNETANQIETKPRPIVDDALPDDDDLDETVLHKNDDGFADQVGKGFSVDDPEEEDDDDDENDDDDGNGDDKKGEDGGELFVGARPRPGNEKGGDRWRPL